MNAKLSDNKKTLLKNYDIFEFFGIEEKSNAKNILIVFEKNGWHILADTTKNIKINYKDKVIALKKGSYSKG